MPNYRELAEADQARRQRLDRRITGKVPAPAEGDPTQTPGAEGAAEVDITEAAKALKLTEAETAEVIERASEGNEVALTMLEKIVPAAPMQRGDGGGVGGRGSTDTPGAIFNQAIRTALRIGHRRQAERHGKSVLDVGGRPTEL